MIPRKADEQRQQSGQRELAVVLHVCVIAGLTLAVASGLVVALTVLPEAVHDTTDRVWIGIGLFGITVACLSMIGLYAERYAISARRRANQSVLTESELTKAERRYVERNTQQTRRPYRRSNADPIRWVLRLLSRDEAERYQAEWADHLSELIEQGEHKQARRDRRLLALTAILLAATRQVRRMLGRAS